MRDVFIKIRMEGISWQIKCSKKTTLELLEVMEIINEIPWVAKKVKPSKAK